MRKSFALELQSARADINFRGVGAPGLLVAFIGPLVGVIRMPATQALELDSQQLQLVVGDIGSTLFCPIDTTLLLQKRRKNRPQRVKLREPMETLFSAIEHGTATLCQPRLPSSSAISLRTMASTDVDDDDDELLSADEDQSDFLQLMNEPAMELAESPRILSREMMEQLFQELPDSLRMLSWERCFCISRDGDSFNTLLKYCEPFAYTVVVIQTNKGEILGGFASEKWRDRQSSKHHRQRSYYGNGLSFLFASHPETTQDHQTFHPSKPLSIYRWSGSNDYCQICNVETNMLAMGGAGDFGLVVRDNFYKGQTGSCRTYNNPPLVAGGAFAGFEITAFEVYGLNPLLSSFSSNDSSSLLS